MDVSLTLAGLPKIRHSFWCSGEVKPELCIHNSKKDLPFSPYLMGDLILNQGKKILIIGTTSVKDRTLFIKSLAVVRHYLEYALQGNNLYISQMCYVKKETSKKS